MEEREGMKEGIEGFRGEGGREGGRKKGALAQVFWMVGVRCVG